MPTVSPSTRNRLETAPQVAFPEHRALAARTARQILRRDSHLGQKRGQRPTIFAVETCSGQVWFGARKDASISPAAGLAIAKRQRSGTAVGDDLPQRGELLAVWPFYGKSPVHRPKTYRPQASIKAMVLATMLMPISFRLMETSQKGAISVPCPRRCLAPDGRQP